MRDRKMCVTEKAFQIPVCPSTHLSTHQRPLNSALSDPGTPMWTGNSETSAVGLCINLPFTYSPTQCQIFGHKMLSQTLNAKENAGLHATCGSAGYKTGQCERVLTAAITRRYLSE